MKRILALSFLAATAVGSLHAVPACPTPIRVTQSDGTVISVTQRGDEHFHWAETTDGRTLLRGADGYWQETDKKTVMAKAAGIRSTATKPLTQIGGTFPTTGHRRMLMLLVNFADTSPRYTREDFDDYMNQPNYGNIGSFRDYYLENSYGALDVETTVTRWITLPYPKSYYGAEQVPAMIAEALGAIAGEIDLTQFDNDGDGILDGLAVIHQGTGQEASGNAADIWSHSAIIYNMEFGGVQVRRYTIQPELLATTGNISTIGVMCHEFGHNLGAPDFYDSDYEASGGTYPGTGVWDILGSGAWNGEHGNRPAGINMWQKIQFGWVTPETLDASASITDMPAAYDAPAAYRFDTTVPNEYFIIENRQQKGNFDMALPGHGMLIYHVSENLIDKTITANTLNAAYPQAIYTVCAGSERDPSDYGPSTYGNINSHEAPFPGQYNVTEFNDRTIPSTKSISGRRSYRALSDITENTDGSISFSYTRETAPGSPKALAATVSKGVVTLTWQAPDDNPGPVSYTVYRNGQSIGETSQPGYTDADTEGMLSATYDVDATYDTGLTSPYVSVSITLPDNKASELSVSQQSDGAVTLGWSVSTRLTRMAPDANENYIQTDYPARELEYVHRFRAQDLAIYKGYRLRRIAFYPCQSPQTATCTLRVWSAEPGSTDNATIVSERTLKEFGSTVWNNVMLTQPVEITGETDIWVGVHTSAPGGVVRLLSDKGPAVEGYGNLIRIDGSDWERDTYSPGNIFCYATLAEPVSVMELPAPGFDTEGTDPELDMFFPIGFTVERDGTRIGTTASSTFTDPEIPAPGTHTYSVSSLYAGSNESHAISADIEIINDALTEIPAYDDAPAIYLDLQGIRVSRPEKGNIYIRIMNGTAAKIRY